MGRHTLQRAASTDDGTAWRLAALLGEVADARWLGIEDLVDRYPGVRHDGGSGFRLALDAGTEVVMSICFATGIVMFRGVTRRRRLAVA